jgi:hypothetical protein
MPFCTLPACDGFLLLFALHVFQSASLLGHGNFHAIRDVRCFSRSAARFRRRCANFSSSPLATACANRKAAYRFNASHHAHGNRAHVARASVLL